jgi:F0F1-type ATP synthase assembly protein I
MKLALTFAAGLLLGLAAGWTIADRWFEGKVREITRHIGAGL